MTHESNSTLMPADQSTHTPPPAAKTQPGKNRLVSLFIHILVWSYAGGLIAAWFLIHREGERWWFATLLLFGPKWIFATPLALLFPLVALLRRRLLWPVTLSALFAVFAVMNFEIPWRTAVLSSSTSQHLRLLTCNTNRQHLNLPALSQAISDAHPDVIVLQEWIFGPEEARSLFKQPGRNIRIDRELVIASRFPIQGADNILPPGSGLEGSAFNYNLQMPAGDIRLVNLHLASPHLVFSAALHRAPDAPDEIADNCLERRIESQRVTAFLNASNTPALLAGDFNTPIDSETFRNAWTNYSDAFSVAGWGFGVTYRVKWTRTRIDHILFDSSWQCRRCWRGPDVGSPHLPLIADLELKK